MRPKLEHEAIYRNHYDWGFGIICIVGIGMFIWDWQIFPIWSPGHRIYFLWSTKQWFFFYKNRKRREKPSKSEPFGMLSQTTLLLLLKFLVSLGYSPCVPNPPPCSQSKVDKYFRNISKLTYWFFNICSFYVRM